MISPRLKRLLDLLEEGSLPWSRFGADREELRSPIAAGILATRPRGAGEVLKVVNRDAFREWILSRFPAAFGGAGGESPRVENLAMNRDTKRGTRGLGHFSVLARAHVVRAELPAPSRDLMHSLVEATQAWGGAALLVRAPEAPGIAGEPRLPEGVTVMTLEGPENFRSTAAFLAEADVFLLCGMGGRMPGAFLEWLAAQPTIQIVHFGDYDPVGLQEFQRLVDRMPGRVRLHVPDRIEDRFRRFSNRRLMEKGQNRAVLASLRRGVSVEMDQVLDLMAIHGPMEQEAVLLWGEEAP